MRHHDGKRFFNPVTTPNPTLRDVNRMLRTRRAPWPQRVPVTPCVPPLPAPDEALVTFVGHSTFLLQTPHGAAITDPQFSERASPVRFAGPRRVRAPGVSLADLPEITVVLLSHNHYDHCDVPSLRALVRRFAPHVVTPLGNGRLLHSLGARSVDELDWWDATTVASFAVTATPARHFSARTPFDRNRALWSGFVARADRHSVYFAGDSGYGPHFAEIAARTAPIDLALLPIGAYEPRWFMGPIHMNPEEAVQAHIDLGARQSVAMHFGTFQLTPEPIDEPAERLVAARRERGIADESFRVLEVGETHRLR